MTRQEIEQMIAQYNITDAHNGNLAIRVASGKITPDALQAIRAAKPEILAYFVEQEQEQQRKMSTFNAIPGLAELREAIHIEQDYRAKLQRAMDEGTGIIPNPPDVSSDAIAAAHPCAAFALKVNNERFSENYEISDIAQRAYDALCSGDDWQAVKASYDADKHAFVERHLWD